LKKKLKKFQFFTKNVCIFRQTMVRYFLSSGNGGMADALDSGSSEGFFMRVQVPLSAGKKRTSEKKLPVKFGW
jgi:hypothetical protein